MSLSSQSELPANKFNLKIPINYGLRQAGIVRPLKMVLDIKSFIEILQLDLSEPTDYSKPRPITLCWKLDSANELEAHPVGTCIVV
jgi:hypothetical protein